MAKALPSFQLYFEPTISQYQTCTAKTKTQINPQNNEPRIQNQNSRSRIKSVNRRELRRYESSVSSTRKLLSLVNSGSLEDALQMFEKMIKSTTFVWNVIIRALVDSGYFYKAIEFYCRMQFEGIKPDKFTFPFIIKACTWVFRLNAAQNIHSVIIKLGFNSDIYICNALIIMYAKVGCIEDSEKIFECMPVRDIVSWNSMISGYVSSGNGLKCLMCFQKMQKIGVKIDKFSYIGALGACGLEGCLLNGKEIFCHVLKNGVELDSMMQSSLIDMFGKCGEVDYAERLFNGISNKNVVVWNTMIGAYTMNQKSSESFPCLDKMQNDENFLPDTITLINLLPSCSKLGALLQGKAIHGYAIRKGYLCHLVLETALVDMYGKCGNITFGEHVFSQMKRKNLVSWNAMIGAYVQNLNHIEAIETFQKLQYDEHCYLPDGMTFTSILSAYAEIALPKEGKQIHCCISKSGFSSCTFISNAMINMYAKCGDLDSARLVFDNMLCKDVITWNTIMMAYAIHGLGSYCFELFSNMKNEGYEPNESTFVSILSACSIAGIVDEGWKYFDLMKNYYGLDHGIEHYGCMLDLMGRIGDLEKAKRLIEEMPLKPTHRIWGSLMSASRHHKNIEMAEVAAEGIFSLNNNNDNIGCYILLSNMYAEAGRWEDVERVRLLMKKRGLERVKECSLIECDGKIHKFRNNEKVQNDRIRFVYDVLGVISRSIGEEDVYFCSDTKFKPLSLLKRRGSSPMWHSVRLAVCFGLIGTSIGKPLIIRKNVRICEDCHCALKRISRVTNREIFVGDSKIFHRFKDGRCSCGDFW